MLLLLTAPSLLCAASRSRWRDDLPGAVFTLAAWAVGAVFLGVYARRRSSSDSLHGVLGAPAAILIFAYYLSLLALIGAVTNAVATGTWTGTAPRALGLSRPAGVQAPTTESVPSGPEVTSTA